MPTWLITGDPASGKTTALSRIILKARTEGYTVGGILTREIRDHGQRIGFRIVDCSNEESEILASSEIKSGPRIGRYRVNLKALSTLPAKAMRHAQENSDIIACDEIGPMELFSPEFRKAVEDSILVTSKPSLCIVHKRLEDPLIERLRVSADSKEFEVTFENRETIPDEIWKQVRAYLKSGE